MTAGVPERAAARRPLRASDYRDLVRRALAEDLEGGDPTTHATVPEDRCVRGRIRAEQACVLAGIEVALEVFRQLDPGVTVGETRRRDGDTCAPQEVVATIDGRAAALLGGERTALNFLQRLSGIATLARRYVEAAAGRTVILDTRKTTPTLRVLEKYAVRVGGAANHRFGLGHGILIKDNHIQMAGSLIEAVRRARAWLERSAPIVDPASDTAGPLARRIEVEAQSLAEVDEALAAGADIVLLDNLSLDEAAAAISRCRGRADTEISGGVTLDRIPALAALGPTYLSVGAITHSACAADLSFDVAPLR